MSLHTYVVARPVGAGVDDTYADLLTHETPADVLEYVAANVALWPPGTKLEWWVVRDRDVGAARLRTVRVTSPHTVGEVAP